ncbi:MAG: 2-oxoacid:acceptor oxidoreductase family protein [Deltaproteobacteria bacterium]|nr:2-oxoacid:acceptor oxidoreductase family protein [Deltaproteobacteria bacterium]
MLESVQVEFCGLGGQGILLMGGLLGEAAVREGAWVAGSNSYGAQARGSGCRAELVLANEPVDFPHVLRADLLVAMSQEAYELYLPGLAAEGLVVCDRPGVAPASGEARLHLPVPATATAVERFKSRQVANMVLLGAVACVTGLVSRDALLEAVAAGVQPRFRELNTGALQAGFALGEEARGSGGEALRRWRERLGLV